MNARPAGELSATKRALLERRLRGELVPPPARIPRRPDQPPVCSFAQERMWFLDRLLAPGSGHGRWLNTIVETARLLGPVDAEALSESLQAVVERHEILRTTFADAAGVPIPVVAPRRPVELPVLDLSSLRPERREAQLESLTRAEAEHHFDLERGPLLRARLVQLAPGEHRLILATHHIVSDAWSMRVLWRETGHGYAARMGRPEPPLATLEVQYLDFAAWQRARAHGESAAHLDYWTRQLRGAPGPIALPGPGAGGPAPGAETLRITRPLADGVGELGRALGTTRFVVMLAAFFELLHAETGANDLVVAVPVAGRRRPELEPLIGPFVNSLPIRCDLAGGPTFQEVAMRVRQAVVAGLEHQDLPFERLVRELRPGRALAANPLTEVAFSFQDMPPPPSSWAGLEVARAPVPTGADKFELALNFARAGDELHGLATFRGDGPRAASVRRLCLRFERTLAAAVADPRRRLEPPGDGR